MESVECQIDSRRKEVDNWMQKCDVVENECLRYSKALGGNVKVAGSSLGELRKEQVLLRRHQMALQHQEKLRQASGVSICYIVVDIDITIVVPHQTRTTDDVDKPS